MPPTSRKTGLNQEQSINFNVLTCFMFEEYFADVQYRFQQFEYTASQFIVETFESEWTIHRNV